jgi:guanylate kinase
MGVGNLSSPSSLRRKNMKKKIFLITAPSGAGKTYLSQRIAEQGYWAECISHTTRPMREGEVDGKTYYFVEAGDFSDSLERGEFAEMVTYDGNAYGIAHTEISRVMNKGKHVFIIVEYNGYKQIKELYPDAIGIFLYMSKEDCLANMLLRGDSIDKAMKRISTYDDEMKNRIHFDYVVKNVRGKQDTSSHILRDIIRQYS